MHPGTAEVARQLQALGAAGELRILDAHARTAEQAAAQLGVDVGAIANSLVFAAGDTPVLILTSGAHRVDTDAMARRIGVPHLGRADPSFVRLHTGQAIGGVAPVGHPQPIRTVVDVALAAYPVVWAAGGHPRAVFPTTFDELVQITGGTSLEVGPDAG